MSKEEHKLSLYRRLSLDPVLYEELVAKENKDVDLIEEIQYVYFQPVTRGSLRASIFCLVCVTIGSWMLSLPYLMKTNGIFLCLAIFMSCAFATFWTLRLLTKTAEKDQIFDVGLLMEKYYGANMIMIGITMSLINTLGSIIAWNVIILNLLSGIISFLGYENPNSLAIYIDIALLVFIMIPISAFDAIGRFHIMSTIGFIFITYLIMVTVFEFPYYFSQNFNIQIIFNLDTYINFDTSIFLECFCIFFFAFGNHSTILSTINEIENKTSKRIHNVANYTFYLEFIIFLFVMFLGYFSTFDSTNEVFIDRPGEGYLMMIAKLFYIIVMLCNIGLYYYMMKPILHWTLNNNKPFGEIENFTITSIILTILVLISFMITKLNKLLSFLGATAQVFLIFIIPISLYIKAFDLDSKKTYLYLATLAIVIIIGTSFLLFLVINQISL